MQQEPTTLSAYCPSSTGGLLHLAVKRAVASAVLTVLLFLSGCASLEESPQPITEITVSEPAPAPEEPVEVPLPEPEPEPQVAVPVPEPEPPMEEPEPHRIAIVLSDRSPAYENVAIELGNLLEDFLLYNLADRSLSPEATFAAIADSDAKAVVAIGLEAAEKAMTLSRLPVVFCQVFNIDVTESVVPIKGVSSIPPLAPQLRAWKQLRPGLTDLGAIVGEGHDDLIAEAKIAAAENGVNLHYRIATSDRETLYMFNRMAPNIDGFWLFPDNRVLSIAILKEMLSYAHRHEVQIAVFNSGLLEMGAALSATTVDSDIARTAIELADRLIKGEADAIPARTPLQKVEMRSPVSVSVGAAAKGTQ